MTVMYTIGPAGLLDSRPGPHKAAGGSVWFKASEAHKYIDQLHTDGVRVQGAVYEVHVGSPLCNWIKPMPKGDFFELLQPAKLVYQTLVGANTEVN